MLKSLRKKKTAKKIWIILTLLILPAFVFWGFGSFVRSKQEAAYAGKISGRSVSLQEYSDALEAVRIQVMIQFGDNLPEIEKTLNLESMAWNRLLLLREAKKRKISATDQEVVGLIKSYPFFHGKDGQFNQQIYSQMLQYGFRTQPRIFEEQVRSTLIISKLYKAITDSVILNEEEIKNEYRKLNEEVSIYYITALASDFEKDIAASDEEIKGYFTKNSSQFKEPLSFNIEYVSLADEDTDESRINDRINKLVSRLNKKEDFTKAAAGLNLEVKETGLFSHTGPIPGIGWSPETLTLISKLRIGEFTQPLYMDKHYYVLRLKEKREPRTPDFQTINDKVKEAFIKEESRKIAQQKIESCLKELKDSYKTDPKSVNFSRTANAYGLKSDSTGLFKYGSYIEGIGASDNFFTVSEGLKEDDFSGIIEMPSGFYIIRLKSRTPVNEKKLQDEKQEFTKKLLLQKKEEYFNRLLQDLIRNVQVF